MNMQEDEPCYLMPLRKQKKRAIIALRKFDFVVSMTVKSLQYTLSYYSII